MTEEWGRLAGSITADGKIPRFRDASLGMTLAFTVILSERSESKDLAKGLIERQARSFGYA